MNKMIAVLIIFLLVITQSGCSYTPRVVLSTYQETMTEQAVVRLVKVATIALRSASPEALERAQAALELARDLNPNDPRIHDGLGCVEWRREHYKLAEHFFRRAIQLDPNYDRGYVHLAAIASYRGDIKDAEELLQIAIKLNPLNFRARNNYAAILLEKGLKKAAIQQLLRAYESAGDDIVLLYNLNQATQRNDLE